MFIIVHPSRPVQSQCTSVILDNTIANVSPNMTSGICWYCMILSHFWIFEWCSIHPHDHQGSWAWVLPISWALSLVQCPPRSASVATRFMTRCGKRSIASIPCGLSTDHANGWTCRQWRSDCSDLNDGMDLDMFPGKYGNPWNSHGLVNNHGYFTTPSGTSGSWNQ